MHTVRLETVRASALVATTRCHPGGRGGRGSPNLMGLMSRLVSTQSDLPGEGYPTWPLPGERAYYVTYPMMHLMLPTPLPPPHEQTDEGENITFAQTTLR